MDCGKVARAEVSSSAPMRIRVMASGTDTWCSRGMGLVSRMRRTCAPLTWKRAMPTWPSSVTRHERTCLTTNDVRRNGAAIDR
jgi:hypothetical protein